MAVAAVFAVAPAQAHTIADSSAPQGSQAEVTGTVEDLVVENPIRGTTHQYHLLRRQDGARTALAGPGSEMLRDGATVALHGRQDGSHFLVDEARELSPPSGNARAARAAGASQVEGTLAIVHADDFESGHGRFQYHVRDDAGAVTVLNVGSLPAELRGGSRVGVLGKRSVDGASVDPDSITVQSEPSSGSGVQSGLVAKAATSNKVLVILANFSNTTAPAFTQSQAQQVMTSSSNSVANFYDEVSYGGQQLNVTVTSTWVRMNLAATCNYSSIGTAADISAQALSSLYNGLNYDFVVYVFPQQNCGWSGLAYVGFPHQSFINGTNAFKTQVVTHEMGHNFGLYHAGGLNCGSATIGGACSAAEYGDPWDTMGNQRAMHYNATQKLGLGWIGATTVKTHSSGSASYTISPLETGGASTYAVKIPTSKASRTYWLEFRQPIGFDAPLSAYPNNGVQVRVSDPFEWTSGSDDTELLDMTPGSTGGFTDSTLVVGQSFLDSTYGVNIIVTGASASAVTVSVTKGGLTGTTTALSSSRNPSTAGTSVTFTATVTGSGPTGTVNFKDGASSIAGCSAVALAGSGNVRTAACVTSALTAGTHSLVASYSGNSTNAASSSAALTQTVNGTGSTTGIATSLTPSTVGASVSFTATVSGAAPTGTINFKDGATSIAGCGSVAVAGSGNIRTAACVTTGLVAGSHSMTAAYSGDASNSASASSPLTQTVNKAVSGTSVASSADPSVAGATVTFTATVTGSGPTGTVNFKDGSTSLSGCSAVALSGSGNTRTAQCGTASLAGGTHSIVASYGGDSNNAGSSSGTLSQTVNNGSSTTTLTSSLNPSTVGASVTFSASVTGTNPTGTVNFTNGGVSVSGCAAVALAGIGSTRTAACTTSNMGAGNHSIVAAYGGDAANAGSTSATLSQTVNKVSSSTALASSRNPSSTGATVTFTASVTGSAPTGTVSFTDNGTSISGCAAAALGGSGNTRTAQCITTGLAGGTHSIVARYTGDATNSASTSVGLSQTVGSLSTPVVLVNSSFEVPALSMGYLYGPVGAGVGWHFSGSSGIQRNGSALVSAPAPDGTQTAFIQANSSISQTVTINAGSYTLSFKAAQRACCVAPYVQPVKVTVDGVQIGGLISPPGTSFTTFSIPFSVASSGAHTISFAGTNPANKTTFIDAVTIQ